MGQMRLLQAQNVLCLYVFSLSEESMTRWANSEQIVEKYRSLHFHLGGDFQTWEIDHRDAFFIESSVEVDNAHILQLEPKEIQT